MAKKKNKPYTCPRCGYVTYQRQHMRKHLFELKKPCPGSENDIAMGDEVKQKILANRIYKVESPVKVVNQTINNYNTMNNFINGIDMFKKLNGFLNHKQIDVVPFDDSVKSRYEDTREQLMKGIGTHKMTQEDIFDIIDEVTKIDDGNMEEFNVMFDSAINKLRMYNSDGDWKEMYVSSGVKTIIKSIQTHYWNAYECYLIRKIDDIHVSHQDRQRFKESLQGYFEFLASIDMSPYIKGHKVSDCQILYSEDEPRYRHEPAYDDVDAYKLVDRFGRLFEVAKEQVSVKRREVMMRRLIDLIKRNTQRNVSELNKLVLNLVNMDTSFQQAMMSL